MVKEEVGDVWVLEGEKEQRASDVLDMVCTLAMEGDKGEQKTCETVWDEKWSSIRSKLRDMEEKGGSIWYVWWMDGVRKFMRMEEE